MYRGIDPYEFLDDKVLWAWNREDVSQFGNGAGGYDYSLEGTPSGTLSVADAPDTLMCSEAPRLVYTHTGNTARAFFLINDLPALPDRFIIEAVIGNRDSNTSPNVIIAFQSTARWFGIYRYATTQLGVVGCNGPLNDGWGDSIGFSQGNVRNIPEGSGFRLICEYRDPDSTHDPGICWWMDGVPGYRRFLASQFSWAGSSSEPKPNVSWNSSWRTGGSIKRLGISFREMGASSGSAFIGDLRILRYQTV